ncbi:hypothetical protein [Martelella mediterranea]|uniref:Uncharacterized protein n=1 Tax=Martelella mediterranea TaxID=293089 RepID=A0A4R3NSV5_9HYPH|nr:hypothetical protein [Martelella mediterranea]TCT40321.1 hypothetical protein EDC90_100943 [Martelella mediterranea]
MSTSDTTHFHAQAHETGTTAAPLTDVSTRFILHYFLGFIGTCLMLMTPAAVTLAVRVGEIAGDRKEAALGTIVGIGAFVAPFFLTIGSSTIGNYPLLYTVAALVAFLGAVFIVPVKGFR